ncbi:MAG: hypothetical protein MZV63_34680 [Marinilabiliales bacterium]|nr:hypothetical protein [Marinilabiliales bacterium]
MNGIESSQDHETDYNCDIAVSIAACYLYHYQQHNYQPGEYPDNISRKHAGMGITQLMAQPENEPV